MMLNHGSKVTRLLLAWAIFAPAFLHSAEGRVYVASEPEGASIFVVKIEGGNTVEHPTQATTPGMVPLEIRVEPYELILRKEGFKEKRFSVQVDKASIIKPAAQKMDPATRSVDILYAEPGWQVFVDGKPVNDAEGNVAKTPCTIQLPDGAKEVQLAKEGFQDLSVKSGAPGAVLEFKGKPWKGQSKLLARSIESPSSTFNPVGQWVRDWKPVVITLTREGTFFVPNSEMKGTYEFKNGIVSLNYGIKLDSKVPVRSYRILDNNTMETDDLKDYAGRKVRLTRSKVSNSEGTADSSNVAIPESFVGTWEIPKYGTFVLTQTGKAYRLEQVGHYQSGTTMIQNGKLAFNWPTNNPVAIVFEAKGGKVYIGCYSRPNGKFEKELFEGTPIWEYEATKK